MNVCCVCLFRLPKHLSHSLFVLHVVYIFFLSQITLLLAPNIIFNKHLTSWVKIYFNLFFLRIHSCRTVNLSFFQYLSNLSYYPFQTLINMSLIKQSSKTTTAAKSTHHQPSQTAAGPTSQAWMTWQTQQMYDLRQKLLTHQPCKKIFHEQKKLQINRQSII